MTMAIKAARLPKILLFLAAVAAVGLYWPGLSGPLVFDDYWNLTPVFRWHAGEGSWLSALLPNPDSIISSRPMAMASFMLTTWLGGVESTFPLKLGNLLAHLLCAVLVWQVMLRALREDPRLSPSAEFAAAVTTAFWLIHPLHVSTVLYSVQRMAQLSAFFSLTAVLVYMIARGQLAAGKRRLCVTNLFVSFPLLVIAGLLSKQNAAIVPFLCLAFELAYFRRSAEARRVLGVFYAIFAMLPLVAILATIIAIPQRILAGYEELEFSLTQRLLTQPRALIDYIGMWFLPRGSSMGLYTDDFPASSGLLTPVTTLPAIVLLVAASAFAIAMRRRFPSILFGWFFFLAAHAVESTFLPLELYYEHRNYLPSVGLMLAAAGMGSYVIAKLKGRLLRLHSTLVIGVSALAVVFAFSTLGRVLIWQSDESLIEQGLRHHPSSLRVHIDRTTVALRTGDYSSAKEASTSLIASTDPRHRLIGHMNLIAVDCVRGAAVDPHELELATTDGRPMLTTSEVSVAMLFDTLVREGYCKTLSARDVADSLAELLDAASSQPESTNNKSTIRRITAQIYIYAGMWPEAELQARIGWEANPTLPLGVTLAHCYLENGKRAQAVAVMAELERRVRSFDHRWQRELTLLRRQAASATGAPEMAP